MELINGESICVLNDEMTIEIGINSNISIPDIICLGEPFDVIGNASIAIGDNTFYQWSSSSGLNFSNPNSLNTSITGHFDSIYSYTDSILVDTVWVMTDSILNNTIPGNQVEFYDISFYAINENGCWQTINDSIQVYEVNAEIDLPIGLPGDQCAGYILNLQTMYDDYISIYEWSHTEFNKITEETYSEIYTEFTDSVMSDQFNYPSIHDFSLTVQSVHGCSDSVTLDSLLDIIQPLPGFYTSESAICDGESIFLVDTSTFMSSDVSPLFIMNQYEPYYGYDTTYVNYQVIIDSTYSNIDSIINIADSVIIDLDSQLWIMSDSLTLDPQYDSIINSLDSLIYISESLLVDSFKIGDTLKLSYDLTTYYNNTYGDSTSVTFNFPYDSDILIGTDSTEYDYDITMIGYAPLVNGDNCDKTFQSSVKVFAYPQIDISVSDSIGCPPFQVQFEDLTTYIISDSSSYFWDFGDGITSNEKNPTHTYLDVGFYNVTLSVTSHNGCSSDTTFESLISVFDHPEASFVNSTVPYCHDEIDVTFYNTSSYETDSVFWQWSFNDVIDSINYDFSPDMEDGDDQVIELIITDGRGCSDSYIDDNIDIEELDEIVEIPILNYITWSDSGLVVVWDEAQDGNFGYLEIFHQHNNMSSWVQAAIIDTLTPNYFVHDPDDADAGLSESTFVNNYYLSQVDSCGYQSDTSIIHSSILLETNSYDYQEIEISWTRYRGWDYIIDDQMIVQDTLDIIYEVYRSENNIDFDRIITVIDTLPYLEEGFKFVDKDLCNIDYTYYVLAKHTEIEDFTSRSNKSTKQPNFVDFTTPIKLSYTTVNVYGPISVDGEIIENYTLTEWEELDQSEMNYYKVDRFDNFYGWQEEVSNIEDSLYYDFNADIYNDEYLYRVSYWDDCGNIGPYSNVGSNILLQGLQTSTHFDLTWNPYNDWDLGVQNYVIEYYQSQDSVKGWVQLDIVSGTTNNYRDSDMQKNNLDSYNISHGIDTSYCYRVRAISYLEYESQSNEYCFIPEPTNYFPNAFSPNNDGINDYFEYKFRVPIDDSDKYKNSSFVKSINLKIFNRWGNLVFETNELDFKWDGTHRGEDSPQGAYVVKYELTGYNGTVISDKGLIYLLR